MALAAARSFDLAAGLSARFVFHDDGSLSGPERRLLEWSLPGSRVVARLEADARADRELAAFPALRAWRDRHVMGLKVVDVALWSERQVICYQDSDVLFFRAPEVLLSALRRPNGPALFNRDLATTYRADPEDLERALGVRPLERGNAGLWAMPRAALSLARMEVWARHPLLQPHLGHSGEQAISVLLGCAGPGGAGHLPVGYDITGAPIGAQTVCRHYAGVLRRGFSEQGLPHLFGPLRFRARWREFVATSRRT
jgi:hypothetical protein